MRNYYYADGRDYDKADKATKDSPLFGNERQRQPDLSKRLQ
jgi:hypothetical protein